MKFDINIPIEKTDIPKWAKQAGCEKCFIFRGNSMLPSLKHGQVVYVRTEFESINPGDVIVYKEINKYRFTVHRVIRKMSNGWILRGDNNSRIDPLPIKPNQIIGRVEIVESNNRIKPIKGGRYALWRARIRWSLKALKKRIPVNIKIIIKDFRQSRIITWLVEIRFRKYMRTICFNTPYGRLIKVTYKGRTIAQWVKGHESFYCKKPFDLFINREDTTNTKY